MRFRTTGASAPDFATRAQNPAATSAQTVAMQDKIRASRGPAAGRERTGNGKLFIRIHLPKERYRIPRDQASAFRPEGFVRRSLTGQGSGSMR